MPQFHNGSGKTTKIGYVNKYDQMCLGTRGKPGNNLGQRSYMMICLKEKSEETICGRLQDANGHNI